METNLAFVGLITVGVVNVITFYKPDLDSKIKFTISLVVALALSFMPESFGGYVADRIKVAIEIAFAASGAYKLMTRAGGK